jgi:coenzyme F420-0:L-glutamate ligase/coenzyme F420-1:gamma-L-glutamate ligase
VTSPRAVTVTALAGLAEIAPGDDLAAMIATAAAGTEELGVLRDRDVLVIAHKVLSKAEGRIRRLSEVKPGERASALAAELGKDARHVQVVLDESREVLRAAHGVLICVTRHGFVCANAGVDASNVRGEDAVVLLPTDPDFSARTLRDRLRALRGVSPAVVITDSFGRAWRHGQTDVAIGCAGICPLEDWRGRTDAYGRELRATWIAIADELAAAADLARAKDGFQPVVVVRGAERYVSTEHGPGAAAMVRPESEDLFR